MFCKSIHIFVLVYNDSLSMKITCSESMLDKYAGYSYAVSTWIPEAYLGFFAGGFRLQGSER